MKREVLKRTILIGGAWPYANGSLHIGHIAALLPGDVLARYHRACGDQVYFVSGSDCHGTPVAIRAKKEGRTPQEISDFYHEEFVRCFEKLGFSYDCYTKTSDDRHKQFVREFHARLYQSDLWSMRRRRRRLIARRARAFWQTALSQGFVRDVERRHEGISATTAVPC